MFRRPTARSILVAALLCGLLGGVWLARRSGRGEPPRAPSTRPETPERIGVPAPAHREPPPGSGSGETARPAAERGPAGKAREEEATSISGTVVREDGGDVFPLSVELRTDPQGGEGVRVGICSVGEDGRYRFAGFPPGRYRVRVLGLWEHAPARVDLTPGLEVERDLLIRSSVSLVVSLRDERGRRLRGLVVVEPIPPDPGARRGTSGADARFALPPGRYRVWADGEVRTATVVEGETTRLEVPVPTGVVSGVVVDEAARPVADVRVQPWRMDDPMSRDAMLYERLTTAREYGGVTDADGAFELPPLGPGRYALFAYDGNRGALAVPVDLPAGKDVGGVRITLVPMAEVRVTVRDRAGKPVYHGVVRATREMATSREERTDADGRATLEVIPGPWTIRVFARDGKGAPLGAREIEVRRSGPNEVSLFVPRSGR